MSHLYSDGDIKTWLHKGAPCEDQRLQDHTCVLACVVQDEWQMHSTSAPPSIAAQQPSVECHVANVREHMDHYNQTQFSLVHSKGHPWTKPSMVGSS